jgi:hypothetical protein
MPVDTASKTAVQVSVFLSYTQADRAIGERLHVHLQENGVGCFFAPETLEPGEFWEPRLRPEIQKRAVFLVLFTPKSSQSGWVRREIEMAVEASREIWVIHDPDTDLEFLEKRRLLTEHQFTLWAGSEQKCFDQVLRRINMRWPPRDYVYSGAISRDNCPYPGPKSFLDPDSQASLFFGREHAINQLKIAIKGEKRVLLVHGPSGAGKTSLLAVGLKNQLPGHYWCSERIEGDTAASLLEGALKGLHTLASHPSPIADRDLERQIVAAIRNGGHNEYVLIFDQMESLFHERAQKGEASRFLETLRNVLQAQYKDTERVTILISFRKEYLADVQPQIREYFPNNWIDLLICKLSEQNARMCMIGPAAECDVLFDGNLADELLAELKEDLGGEPTVNPMDLQKVCQKLWHELAQLALDDGVRKWSIDTIALKKLSKPARSFANGREYVKTVLGEFLQSKIKEIAQGIPEKTTHFPEKYVPLALMEFVGPHNERLPVRLDPATGKAGKLDFDVLQQLVAGGLVQSRAIRDGIREFELCHDSLAMQIGQDLRTDDSVFAVKSLGAALAREDPKERRFNRHTDLLERLDAVRKIEWKFDDDEAEFLVRSALGDKRTAISPSLDALEQWALLLKDDRLARVIKDGLTVEDRKLESVRLDAINLLLKPKIREKLLVHHADLAEQVEILAMDSKLEPNVRAKACEALAVLGHRESVGNLFEHLKSGNNRTAAKKALAFTKDAVGRQPEGSGPGEFVSAFRQAWKRLGPASRYSINQELCKWRWQNCNAWILFLIAVASPGAAIGAMLFFIPVGWFGASLTMGTTDLGAAVGIFHGFTGGLIWGLGVTVGILAYGVLWRGGVIRTTTLETIGFCCFGMLGAALGGLGNSAVIAFVFEPEGLVNAGWLMTKGVSRTERIHQVFSETMHGWITPVFGAALGLGIAWSLVAILRDPNDAWITRDPKSGQILIRRTFRRIVWKVSICESWRNAICLAVGAVVICLLINPGDGVCDPDHYKGASFQDHVRPTSIASPRNIREWNINCQKRELPSKNSRTAGLALVILGGSLGQEILFLFGLLMVEFGSDVKKLKENPRFLRSVEAHSAS